MFYLKETMESLTPREAHDEYESVKAKILYELDEEEFRQWLVCDDCCMADYDALMTILREESMYDRQITTWEYMQKL